MRSADREYVLYNDARNGSMIFWFFKEICFFPFHFVVSAVFMMVDRPVVIMSLTVVLATKGRQ